MNYLANQTSSMTSRVMVSDAALALANAHISYRLAYLARKERATNLHLTSMDEALAAAQENLSEAAEDLRLLCRTVAAEIHTAD